MTCVKNVSKTDNACLKKCQGHFITGVDQRDHDPNQMEEILSKVKAEYELYKSGFPLNPYLGTDKDQINDLYFANYQFTSDSSNKGLF